MHELACLLKGFGQGQDDQTLTLQHVSCLPLLLSQRKRHWHAFPLTYYVSVWCWVQHFLSQENLEAISAPIKQNMVQETTSGPYVRHWNSWRESIGYVPIIRKIRPHTEKREAERCVCRIPSMTNNKTGCFPQAPTLIEGRRARESQWSNLDDVVPFLLPLRTLLKYWIRQCLRLSNYRLFHSLSHTCWHVCAPATEVFVYTLHINELRIGYGCF